ncbi:hypothetical protein [Ahrensia sp. R2A130]|uniref:hypothetical protein n=1 Tax=Ahrensia sp. R2A130 TaxID=744979 RepID=UPI0001E0E8B9|nr:hypothetical protein [Ahrensia sp. R2A130]EFL88951.1 conserved hypothetical protein [Ahrensia sp. R2A130]
MKQPNRHKWLAARRLHEAYGVDHHVIADVADTTLAAIRYRASSEGWGHPGMAFALHARLLKLVEAQFDRIANSDESIEKTARATASVAKIVEDALDHDNKEREKFANDRYADDKNGSDDDWRKTFLARVEDAARAECEDGNGKQPLSAI